MNTSDSVGRSKPGRRPTDWQEAFATEDPAVQWAAACSVADVVTARDRWVDSTALHEARCGAFEAAVAAARADRESIVPAAIAGARRALYWERQARTRLVPPVSLGLRRWRVQRRTAGDVEQFVSLSTVAEAETDGGSFVYLPIADQDSTRCRSATLDTLARHLVDEGWRWSIPPVHALEDAVQAVLAVGRERAAASLTDMYPALPPAVADGMVMLVAGSRLRSPRPWPGAVWLAAHRGESAALADPGTRAVVDALIRGRHARPSSTIGATVLDRAARHLHAVPDRGDEATLTAANPTLRPLAVAS